MQYLYDERGRRNLDVRFNAHTSMHVMTMHASPSFFSVAAVLLVYICVSVSSAQEG